MKNLALLIIVLFSFISCSKKQSGTKSNFKIFIGALSVPMSGGAFVETEDLALAKKNLIKLDADDSAIIPFGTYNLLFVAFTGPAEKAGNMYCGSVANAILQNPTATINVTITQANCSQPIYADLILKLIGGNASWDSALFDQGKWGP